MAYNRTKSRKRLMLRKQYHGRLKRFLGTRGAHSKKYTYRSKHR